MSLEEKYNQKFATLEQWFQFLLTYREYESFDALEHNSTYKVHKFVISPGFYLCNKIWFNGEKEYYMEVKAFDSNVRMSAGYDYVVWEVAQDGQRAYNEQQDKKRKLRKQN